MRVVSLVPSWTETLLECSVNVVGRTRFCIHPAEAIREIPALGGTKELDRSQLEALKPDMVLLDKEENVPAMAEAGPWRTHVTHVEHVRDVAPALRDLARVLSNERLVALAVRWEKVLSRVVRPRSVREIPGLLDWVSEPTSEPERVLYLIWRCPWMTVAPNTFVGSMLERVGLGDRLPSFPEKYPKIDLADFDPAKTLLLFSSEPYPFAKKRRELTALGFPAALVDGEAYSWFGLRSLRFLEQLNH